MNTKTRFCELLRAAASQSISEAEFWDNFNRLEYPANDATLKIAYDVATHFWGNFHERNLLFIRAKPDRHQLQQGKDQLNLIAEALEAGWSVSELQRRLDDI